MLSHSPSAKLFSIDQFFIYKLYKYTKYINTYLYVFNQTHVHLHKTLPSGPDIRYRLPTEAASTTLTGLKDRDPDTNPYPSPRIQKPTPGGPVSHSMHDMPTIVPDYFGSDFEACGAAIICFHDAETTQSIMNQDLRDD